VLEQGIALTLGSPPLSELISKLRAGPRHTCGRASWRGEASAELSPGRGACRQEKGTLGAPPGRTGAPNAHRVPHGVAACARAIPCAGDSRVGAGSRGSLIAARARKNGASVPGSGSAVPASGELDACPGALSPPRVASYGGPGEGQAPAPASALGEALDPHNLVSGEKDGSRPGQGVPQRPARRGSRAALSCAPRVLASLETRGGLTGQGSLTLPYQGNGRRRCIARLRVCPVCTAARDVPARPRRFAWVCLELHGKDT